MSIEKSLPLRSIEMTTKDQSLPPELQVLIRRASMVVNNRILRIKQVRDKTGIANSTLWKMISGKVFPPQLKISPRSVGWLESEIDAVISARIFASCTQKPVDMQMFIFELIASRTSQFSQKTSMVDISSEKSADASSSFEELISPNKLRGKFRR